MTTTDTAATLATPEVSAPATEPAPVVAKPAEKAPRKARFTGKLKAAKPAAKATKPVKAAKPLRVKPEVALRAVLKGKPLSPPKAPKDRAVPFSDTAKIVMINSVNPCRPGTGQHANFDHVKKFANKTVVACKKASGGNSTGISCALRRWVDRGFIKIVEK